MDYQKGIKFIDQIIELRQHPPWIFPLDSKEDLISLKGLLWRGDRFENMWNRLREDYGSHYYKHPIDEHVSQMSPIDEILNRLETEFFGSRPKTSKEKINDILDMVEKARSGGKTSATDIVKALESLRDEEENV